MSKTKFKSGDLVENLCTLEINMINKTGGKVVSFITGYESRYLYGYSANYLYGYSANYRLINPKEVKFNLKNK